MSLVHFENYVLITIVPKILKLLSVLFCLAAVQQFVPIIISQTPQRVYGTLCTHACNPPSHTHRASSQLHLLSPAFSTPAVQQGGIFRERTVTSPPWVKCISTPRKYCNVDAVDQETQFWQRLSSLKEYYQRAGRQSMTTLLNPMEFHWIPFPMFKCFGPWPLCQGKQHNYLVSLVGVLAMFPVNSVSLTVVLVRLSPNFINKLW